MANEFLDAAFDTRSLGMLGRFPRFQKFLEDEMAPAMDTIGSLVAQSAETNTWTAFQNPTGVLAGTIGYKVTSPMSVSLIIKSPYGARREFGFYGADSLGRVYNDLPEPYAIPAINENEVEIVAQIRHAANMAFASIAGDVSGSVFGGLASAITSMAGG